MILALKQRIFRLAHDLAAQKSTSKGLMDALTESQQQHEAATQSFEVLNHYFIYLSRTIISNQISRLDPPVGNYSGPEKIPRYAHTGY